MEGLTGLKTVAIRFRRPNALSTPCVFLGRPIDERMSVILKYGIVWPAEEDKVRLDLDGSVVGQLGKVLNLENLFECRSTGP